MSLTLPTPLDLQKHKEGVSDEEALARASDLFRLATGIDRDPDDAFERRLIQQALLDMAWYLQTVHEDLEEQFSPFSGERIGSYSYQKAQAAVNSKQNTGVPGFDTAVAYFLGLAEGGAPSTSSEWVFKPGYREPMLDELIDAHDPPRLFHG